MPAGRQVGLYAVRAARNSSYNSISGKVPAKDTGVYISLVLRTIYSTWCDFCDSTVAAAIPAATAAQTTITTTTATTTATTTLIDCRHNSLRFPVEPALFRPAGVTPYLALCAFDG